MAVTAPLPSFKAPSLAPEKARLLNALCVRGGAWPCPFAGGDALWQLLPQAPDFRAPCQAEILIGGDVWFAALSDSSVLFRHEAFAVPSVDAPRADLDEADLPEDVRAAVLASLFEPALQALRAALDRPCSLRDLRFDPAPAGDAALSFGLRLALPPAGGLPAQSVFLRLVPAKADCALRLADALNALPRKTGALAQAAAQAPLDLSLEAGFVRLPLRDAAALAAGDVLIPDEWPADQGRLTLRADLGLAGTLCAPCTLTPEGRAVLVAPLAPLAEAPEAGTDALTAPADVEIRLSFEKHRFSLAAARLGELTQGFELPLGAGDAITVLARGKAIARGRLADLDGVTGIVLTETIK